MLPNTIVNPSSARAGKAGVPVGSWFNPLPVPMLCQPNWKRDLGYLQLSTCNLQPSAAPHRKNSAAAGHGDPNADETRQPASAVAIFLVSRLIFALLCFF